MPINQEDIYLKKSEVQDDTDFGGGGLTNNDVLDGVSNNLFPDSSDVDRAIGRCQIRKVFGMAQTSDTDTLMGALAMITRPPDDPLVHVALFETEGWGDRRALAKQRIERYLVKGPLQLCRIQDVHFSGATNLQLYNIAPATGFPNPGDTIVLRNPSGEEQYDRILRTSLSTAIVILDGKPTTINLCSCELSNELDMDISGRAIQLGVPSSSNTAVVYTTTPAVGAKFYSVKKLGVDGAIGDGSVTVSGGIFTPLVPSNTIETPVIDVFPLIRRPAISRTGGAPVILTPRTLAVGPGVVIPLPTAVTPGTVELTSAVFTILEGPTGELSSGSLAVGRVYHADRRIEFYSTCPGYVSATVGLQYVPATISGAASHSGAQEITSVNQGLAWVSAFEPAPAPGTLSVHYMAQGRWYELSEDGTGKLSGGDSSYGSGALSFATGSLSMTLGALPDVGSDILFLWGEATTAQAAVAGVPSRMRRLFQLAEPPAPGSLVFNWTVTGNPNSCTVSATGEVTPSTHLVGPLTRDDLGGYSVWIEPSNLPDPGTLTCSYQTIPESSTFTNSGGGSYTLPDTPILPGSIQFRVLATSTGVATRLIQCRDDGAGTILAGGQVIGTVNYATGLMNLSSPVFYQEVWSSVKTLVTT